MPISTLIGGDSNMSNDTWLHPMGPTEYHGLCSCCCGRSNPVMMSEARYTGILNGVRMGEVKAYACCQSCGRRTMNIEYVADITFEDYCMVTGSVAKIWNECTSKN